MSQPTKQASWLRASPSTWLRRCRRATLLLALLGGLYVYLRIELMTLPIDGCSPLFGVDPGDRMLLDRRATDVDRNDAVLFEGPEGRMHLGRVVDAPADLSAEARAQLDAGALWVVVEQPDCPGLDSTSIGPVERERVRAEVLFFFDGSGAR
ncbi:MAG: hypothetical protein AAFZ65_18725 [Planctomycetota bacterium]